MPMKVFDEKRFYWICGQILEKYIKMLIFSEVASSRTISIPADILNYQWPIGKLFSVTASSTSWKVFEIFDVLFLPYGNQGVEVWRVYPLSGFHLFDILDIKSSLPMGLCRFSSIRFIRMVFKNGFKVCSHSLTHFMPLVSFYTPENIRKPEVFYCLQGV